jgi:hypothetical protein
MHGREERGWGEPGFWKKSSPFAKVAIVAGGAALLAGILALAGLVFMILWNWLMPSIFGLRDVGYWESWGLLVLASLLFGRAGGHGGRFSGEERRKRRLRERMRQAAAGASGEPGGDAEGSSEGSDRDAR